ncbi:MAG: serine hydroxymethyltransferase, partial [Phototrophicales bacterium]
EIYRALELELQRQREGLEMIPSENLTSIAVMQAQGSVATNKYAEGYPGRRYYGGNEFIDVIENTAIERACKLFGVDHANVQPHSGCSANMAAFWALLEPGDTLMGMRLDHGGHLTHGYKLNFSAKIYNSVQYGVNQKNHLIDFNELRALAKEHKPKVILAGITAYTREVDFKKFKDIADEVGAYLMADIAHISGLIAAGEHQSPVQYCDVITSTTHKTLRGPRGGIILCKKELAKKIDKAIIPGLQGGPLEHVIAAKAICFKEAMSDEFKSYIKQVKVNAHTLAKELK